VIWRSLTHRLGSWDMPARCCELLSICDLTIFDTPCHRLTSEYAMLWIAFNLWFDDLWHTYYQKKYWWQIVVNCFQFVIWRSLTHLFRVDKKLVNCCELLSICDLTIFDTPLALLWNILRRLWIAFNLWFDDLWHTISSKFPLFLLVVNCFQFVIWRSLTHHRCSLMSG